MLKIKLLVICTLFVLFAGLLLDRWYIPKQRKVYEKVGKEIVLTANKLNTARIIHDNLNHVRDLVFNNMQVRGHIDTIGVETSLFRFLTESVEDLKLKLVSVKPIPPSTKGRIETFPYEIEVEGDFFKFGELCSKLENSRRILRLKEYKIDLIEASNDIDVRLKGQTQPLKIKMTIEAFWVK